MVRSWYGSGDLRRRLRGPLRTGSAEPNSHDLWSEINPKSCPRYHMSRQLSVVALGLLPRAQKIPLT
jgi:hypothetical protein